ncbi:MAG TPA: hypothetical protein VJN18_06935 [Polyangiaceae bacterium]|nr:hypothetical protein [Polyangiaceae bacterium]
MGGQEEEEEASSGVEKSITANGDQRVKADRPNSNPGNSFALFEAGGSGTMVDGRVYTAAHILFNNAAIQGTNGWRCKDGSVQASCAVTGFSRWRFGGRITTTNGVETQTWASAWAICGFVSVPNGWINMVSTPSHTTFARWDYGLQNLDGCVPAGAGSIGWWVTNQATLRTHLLFQGGYAQRLPCPALTTGSSADCPAGTVQLRSNTPGSAYSGGSLFWTDGGFSDPALIVTGGYIRSANMDITLGHSGGSVIAFHPPTKAWWSVGSASNSAAGESDNWYNHLTAEVQAFLYQ